MEVKVGYKRTEVGVIPESWDVEPLLSCCNYADYRGKTPPKAASGTFLITARNVRKGFIDYNESQEYVPTELYEQIMQRGKPRIGDVLITTEAPLGNVAQVDREDVALAQRLIKYRPKNSSLSACYLKHYLLSDRFQQILHEHSSGSTAKGIKGSVLHHLPVVIPPPAEQRAIAEALSDADSFVVCQGQLLAKKRQLRKGAMQELLTGQKRLPGFSGDWNVKQIGQFSDCTAGGTPSTRVSEYWGGTIRWMNSGELNMKIVGEVEGRITEEGLRNSSTTMLPPNCVLIGLAGQGRTRGTVAMNLVPLCTNQSIAAILPNASFCTRFLYYNLDSRYDELRELSPGEGGRGGLNLTIIRQVSLPFPSLEEQTAIAAILSDVDAEIAELEAKLAKASALKQGMTQELLAGRIRLI